MSLPSQGKTIMFRLGNVVIVLFLLLIPVVYRVSAFTLRSGAPSASGRPLVPQSFAPFRRPTMCLWDAITPVDDEDDDEDDDENEEIEPGEMRVSEIKAELDLRGVEYKDCFDKESLSQRLMEARVSGKADPKILEKFNRAKLEQTFREETLEIKDEDLAKVTASDGKLPGGMDPDTFKKLIGNPEVMALLQSSKMQEAMQLMMTCGQEELEKRMGADPELQEVIQKLDGIMKTV